jgi:hypothetical protein
LQLRHCYRRQAGRETPQSFEELLQLSEVDYDITAAHIGCNQLRGKAFSATASLMPQKGFWHECYQKIQAKRVKVKSEG